MKITIYDLLGLVKDGKAPKEIKYKNFVYGWVQKYKTYTRYDITGKDLYITTNNLNDEVEIIDEAKEDKIQKIYHCETSLTQNKVEIFITENLNQMVDKINELIDEINNLKEK